MKKNKVRHFGALVLTTFVTAGGLLQALQAQRRAPVATQRGSSMELNTDRTGMDYKDFDLSEARPELCREACACDPNCRAYTYVKPGIQGPKARCWLKFDVPNPVQNQCCVSGVKKVTVAQRSPVTTGKMLPARCAPTKPDFSGVWKMNREKSKFVKSGPDALLIRIDHKEPALTEEWSKNGGISEVYKFTIDGRERNQLSPGPVGMTSAKWEGDALVINVKATDEYWTYKATLSADGKTMTMVVTHPDDSGKTVESIVVFEKQ